MVSCRRIPRLVVLLSALAGPAGAQSAGAAAQTPQAVLGFDLQATIGHLEQARGHYTSNRQADAQRELSSALDLVRLALATEKAQPASPVRGQLPRAGRDVPMPGLLKRLEPAYPLEAARLGITGQVIVDVVIGKNGQVRDARIARSIPELDGAALAAVRQSRFAQPRVDGVPSDVEATLVLAFTLRRSPAPTDDIDLARFYVERADHSAAEPPLVRALETVTRENECFATASNVSGMRGPRGAGTFEPPRKIKDVKPIYPGVAQKARLMGTVMIDAVIGLDGRVKCMRVLRSAPLLDQAALDAVGQWEFTPVLVSGAPVPFRMTVSVGFSLQ
jgi:TonB family protein